MYDNTSLDQLGVTAKISCKRINKLDDDSAEMETNDIDHLVHHSSSPSMAENGGFGLSPVTPDSNKEDSKLMSCFTSPLTSLSSPHTPGFCMNEDEDDNGSRRTLKDDVFDLLATGADEPKLAPLTMKHFEESRSYAARRLDYNPLMTLNDCEKPLEDDMLLEAVYDSLLECIMSKQAEGIVVDISAVDSSPYVPKTPRFVPRLTGIAEICPRPPLKSIKKSRNIDLSLCRRLEFDFEV